MNTFMNQLKATTNYGYTENGALKHNTTTSAVLDMFALGGAYRKRSDEDCILLFKNAFEEDPVLAIKCLFYLRDVRGGQGERRYFRTVYRWLCKNNYAVAEKNLEKIPEFGRWDDLIYITEGTGLEIPAFILIKYQLFIDKQSKTPSLLAKWMPSQNASNVETKRLGHKLANFLEMTDREYRKTLSTLRERIKVLETLMSQNRWDEIEFDKIPSRAGLIYKNAFAHKEVTAARYAAFMKNKANKVNAGALYPYEIVAKAINHSHWDWKDDMSEVDRQALEKYWNNLPDYFANTPNSKMMCVVDTSGSMTGSSASAPINVAISLGMYAAERANGPFKDHYISFSRTPQLIKIEGIDFVDKVRRIYRTNLCENTNLSAVFDMLLAIADKPNVREEDIPNHLVIISDMEIDYATSSGWYSNRDSDWSKNNIKTTMESIRSKWAAHGHKMPKLTYWNVDARNNTILDAGPNVSFVSGMSPSIFTQVMTGKSAWDLMIETLMSDRYKTIKV